MGFIKAFTGALSGTFADQWKDYYVPASGVSATAAVFKAVPQSQNNGTGENYKGSNNIITNGSKIVVPEGLGLITVQDGAITGFIAEPGGFEFKSDDPNSQSIFAGDGIIGPLVKQTWERVKFGGQPAAQQLAFYVNLKEIAGVRFGTQTTIQWNDSWFQTKVGAVMRGTYSIRIVDPLLFVKQFVPYLQPDSEPFDFNALNDDTNALLNEFTSCLSSGVSQLSVEAAQANQDTYDYISINREAFSKKMTEVLEADKHWTSQRGLSVSNISIQMEYDEATKELQKEFQLDDKEIRKTQRMANVYSNNMQGAMAAAAGTAMQNAASNENGAMMGFMGMNMAQNAGSNMLGAVANMQQPATPAQGQQNGQAAVNPTDKLLEMKKLLDAGAISQEEYDKVKKDLLGL